MHNKTETEHPDFHHLTPDAVLALVEEALGVRCTNLCRPLNSYINRVYEVVTEHGEALIAKFYRPGRWDHDALLDEQDFVLELAAAEVPVVAPLQGKTGKTLHERDGMFFTVLPKRGGRICDEPSPDQWRELGRLLARVHLVGAAREPRARPHLTPGHATAEQVEYVLGSGLVPASSRPAYEEALRSTLELIRPCFADEACIRIHGDCHHQNLIYRPGESFFIIDFDDMAVGPPVQDVWMLLPGRVVDAQRELELFIEGYETFRPFDDGSLKLVEPLRAMRYIHYTAWCVRQAADGGFARLAPDWGSVAYWRQEANELVKQQAEVRDSTG